MKLSQVFCPFFLFFRKRLGAKLVTDPKERDKVLKQSFSADRVPSGLDAIVIGSGIGGLTTAALLAKVGKKVLVLEQHDQVYTKQTDWMKFYTNCVCVMILQELCTLLIVLIARVQ